ncbi:MAG: hypothetical protein ACC707_17870 [Thiohalomonadales bacterium]
MPIFSTSSPANNAEQELLNTKIKKHQSLDVAANLFQAGNLAACLSATLGQQVRQAFN